MTASNDTEAEALARQWFDDLFTRGETGVADEILAEDVAYHGPRSLAPRNVTGPDDIKEFVEVYRTAFPDLRYTVEDVSEADGEVRVRWSVTGTHENELFDVEPTGEAFTVAGIDVFTVESGEITEIYAHWDTLKMVQELGIVQSHDLIGE